jgi:hypothetical protein
MEEKRSILIPPTVLTQVLTLKQQANTILLPYVTPLKREGEAE